ncbi:hydroxyphenylacetyl-CoA thioesterase PaaI [Curvivirga aplysinae]|uniref:hydroxyphenylacetyl-CoA thioesterase PaaI n=1 Tax=Curvivirga aplysinae TaxID=2529852 RepID=UPI002E253827
MALTDKEVAEKSATAMWANDDASKGLGMDLVEVDAGYAKITMPITKSQTNGLDTCHGGFIFTLADSAFAFACNSRNQQTVAQHCSINFVAPAFEGDVLCAEAKEVAVYGRSGIYDIRVTNQKNELIAEFRGNSRSIRGAHF